MQLQRTVIAIYIDPDFYPPTINAIVNIAQSSREVIVISRNNCLQDYPFPPNVFLKKVGKYCTVRTLEKQPAWLKAVYFLRFSFYIWKYSKSKKTGLVVLYDHIALFAFYIDRQLLKNKKIWYHNHDMPIKGLLRKKSIGGFAATYENAAMRHIDYFSLPSQERLQYYPHIKREVSVFIIPNYPSLQVYQNIINDHESDGQLKMILQGFIGSGRGLEELIRLLNENINGYSLQLILKGSVTDEYKTAINSLAARLNVVDQITWIPIGAYKELPGLTASCDVGIGINMNTDIVNENLGTASNKIYEYAASGLPVIVYDNPQFRKYLGGYDWAFFTDGSAASIKTNLTLISSRLQQLKESARKSFQDNLNFENYFCPVFEEILYAKPVRKETSDVCLEN